jgi:D-glycerate 3-kinase
MSFSDILSVLEQLKRSSQLSREENQILQAYSFYQPDPFIEQKEDNLYQQKKELFAQVYLSIKQLFSQQKFAHEEILLTTLWSFWLPLALELAQKKQEKGSNFIFGILGGQGTGKTTLTKILPLIWRYLNLSSVAISIDDLYKTYAERQALLKIDPRLIWRGPPGTHDVELGLATINQLQQGQTSVTIPRFDKSAYQGMGDRTNPEIVNSVEIIILEGWFVGVKPVDEKFLANPPFPIVSEEDKQFARDNNERLKEYLPLWEKLDYLMIFNPREYQYSLQWRKEAENQMIAQGKTGMTDEQIEEFVDYFWKALHPEIYLQPLISNPETTDLVVDINFQHGVEKVYRPNQLG